MTEESAPAAATDAGEAAAAETAGGEPAEAPAPSPEVTALRERIDALEAAKGGEEEAATPGNDLFDLLSQEGADEEEGGDDQEIDWASLLPDGGEVNQAATGEQDIEARIAEGVEKALEPHFQAAEVSRRRDGLEKLATEFPDIGTKETLDKLEPYIAQVAQSYGGSVFTDPVVIRMAYMAHKASEASDAETSAEAARGRGATLETDAGAGGRDGATDADQDEIAAMLGSRPAPSRIG